MTRELARRVTADARRCVRGARSLRLAWLAPLLVCAGCLGPNLPRARPEPPDGEPRTSRAETHRTHDSQTGQVVREWTTVHADGKPAVKHGKESVWRADGTKEWEKEYDHGRPSGVHRSWYANGQMRSECFYAGPNEERVMTWWYENGQRRMQGPAKDGVRWGLWRFWYQNGQLAEEGSYEASLRAGEWRAWSEDGKRAFVRSYKKNVRVSERELAPTDAPAK